MCHPYLTFLWPYVRQINLDLMIVCIYTTCKICSMILPFALLAYLFFHDYPCCISGEFVGNLTTVSIHGFEMAYNVLTSITWLCSSNFILTSLIMTCVMVIYLGKFLYTKILNPPPCIKYMCSISYPKVHNLISAAALVHLIWYALDI